MESLRPAGAGSDGSAQPFVRPRNTPRAALILETSGIVPSEWATAELSSDANLGHALGYTCEVRRNDIVLLNPLGEGVVKSALPDLSDEWLSNVHHDGSSAIFLVKDETIVGATVRTAVADDAGAAEPVGRNSPCPCDSGKKYKHCHGKS